MSMKHMAKTLGLAVVAMLAVAAVASSAAFASSEFTREGGGSVAGITSTGSGTNPSFETSGGAIVTCEKSESVSEIKASKEAEATVTFSEGTGKKECEIKGGLAGEGKCGKSIKTEKLTVNPVEIAAGSGVIEPTERGLLFSNKNEINGVMAKFTCTGNAGEVTVKGRLVCESRGAAVKNTNVFSNEGTIVCTKGANKGEQLYTKITGSSETFELKATASIFKITEKDAQITTEKVKYSANIKQT